MRNGASWCVWLDSNEHCMRSRRIPSADWGTDANMEDQVGLEPTKLAHRVKRPVPLPLGSLIQFYLARLRLSGSDAAAFVHAGLPSRSGETAKAGGRVWLRSTCRRVKSPLPLHSGLRLRVHVWPPSGQPSFAEASEGILLRAILRSASARSRMVAPRGFDPRFLGYRPSALATRRRGNVLVRPHGFEPRAFCMSRRRSDQLS
jgi:hypothetical protein